MKNNKGITLVALVVTIVVLLILAGVSINLVLGNNGIIAKAKEAETKSAEASQNDLKGMNSLIEQMESTLNGSGNGGKTEPETVPYLPSDDFHYDTSTSVDTGLIIADSNGNEYVWVVVPRTAAVYKTTGLGKTTFTDADYRSIETDLKNYTSTYGTTDDFSDTWYADTNNEGWLTEAEYKTLKNDMLKSVYENGGFYVGRYEAGVSTLDETTNTFKDSVTFANNKSLFNAVGIQSGINGWGRQNYNFIARGKVITDSNYPNNSTGNIVEKANSIPYYHADYYTAVEMSKRLYSNNSYVQSGLITGTQWDMMMKFLSDLTNYSDMKSTQWGNYDNVPLSNLRGYYTNVNISDGGTEGFKKTNELKTDQEINSWVILTTGSTEQVLRKGLYDVAGNLWEWTQEASYVANLGYNTTYNTYNLRGGSFGYAYASVPACYRGYFYAPTTGTNDGFRPVLYIK